MATLVVRNLSNDTKERLRIRAARQGRSLEAEARAILDAAVPGADPGSETLGQLVARYFGPEHGVDLDPYLPPREPIRDESFAAESPAFGNLALNRKHARGPLVRKNSQVPVTFREPRRASMAGAKTSVASAA